MITFKVIIDPVCNWLRKHSLVPSLEPMKPAVYNPGDSKYCV